MNPNLRASENDQACGGFNLYYFRDLTATNFPSASLYHALPFSVGQQAGSFFAKLIVVRLINPLVIESSSTPREVLPPTGV